MTQEEKVNLILGNSLEKLKELKDNSVDSIVTDPPYELGFMGKSWDNTGIANNPDLWAECLRVLKPGGHLLAFSGTRTYHRMAVAIEDAGFEVRDMIEWVYGSGFPKSLNIGKAIEAKELTGSSNPQAFKYLDGKKVKSSMGTFDKRNAEQSSRPNDYTGTETTINHILHTENGKQWEGWGTALKPAHEPICMARKPLSEKTVAQNVLKYGTGGINIDESRVEYQGDADWNNTFRPSTNIDKNCWIKDKNAVARVDIINRDGRFPANLIHDNSDEVRECFPETKTNAGGVSTMGGVFGNGAKTKTICSLGDSGSAARFFKSIIYNPKASKAERNKGCEGLEEKETKRYGDFEGTPEHAPKLNVKNTNNHPTVKPIALMEYLIKMVTPKGGTVLDPFMGSGSTGVAAKKNGYNFIGIDMTPEYIEIAEARINAWQKDNKLL